MKSFITRIKKGLFALAAVLAVVSAPSAHAVGGSSIIQADICGGVGALALNLTAPIDQYTSSTASITFTGTVNHASQIRFVENNADIVTPINGSLGAANVSFSQAINFSYGDHTVTVRAHGCGPDVVSTTVTIHYPAPIPPSGGGGSSTNNGVATITPIVTNNTSPALLGSVGSPTDVIRVTINGVTYTATNNGNGTWSLPAGTIQPALTDGSYPVRVVALDGTTQVVKSDITVPGAVRIDTVAPTGTVTSGATTNVRSPEIRGTVDDPTAKVFVEINGKTYQAVNNGDGTWVLPAGTIDQLASGSYPMTVRFVDAADNQSQVVMNVSVNATGELGFILAPNAGFIRVLGYSLYTKYLYVLAAILVIVAGYMLFLRRYKIDMAALGRNRRRDDKNRRY